MDGGRRRPRADRLRGALAQSHAVRVGRRLSAFSSGVNQLLFSNGVPINIDAFTEPAVPGKVPLNIVYLNTIQDENQKQYFVQELSRELYDWMLTQQPAEGELKLLFFMDEVAPYLPPHPVILRPRPHQTHLQAGPKVRRGLRSGHAKRQRRGLQNPRTGQHHLRRPLHPTARRRESSSPAEGVRQRRRLVGQLPRWAPASSRSSLLTLTRTPSRCSADGCTPTTALRCPKTRWRN